MNLNKYRKLYLTESWNENKFVMIKHWSPKTLPEIIGNTISRKRGYRQAFINHPLVSSGDAFWINDHELCTGYVLRNNLKIFRPIFSHRRQQLLNKVNSEIPNPYRFWKKLKSRAFVELYKKNIPTEIIYNIITFTYI